jgi:acetyl esterase/lipase
MDMVDPELVPLLDQFPTRPLTTERLAEMRSRLATHTVSSSSDTLVIKECFARGLKDAPDVRFLLYAPRETTGPVPVVLHIHGGGYVAGRPEMADQSNKALAETIGCAVVSVDYRLAPETPYPGALEDCYAVLLWIKTQAEIRAFDSRRIAVAGESAGGGLAAALALYAQDKGDVSIAFQLLNSPMLDDRTCLSAMSGKYGNAPVWPQESNSFGWTAYLGHASGEANTAVYAAPGRAEDLTSLPPTFIGVGALDLFLEENLDFARRLIKAGVPTEMHVYPRAFHGFALANDARVSRRYRKDAARAFASAFAQKASLSSSQ